MSGIVKKAQDTTSFFNQGNKVITNGDVYDQIRKDRRLSFGEQERVVTGFKTITQQKDPHTPLAAAFAAPAGAVAANVAARHFKLGPVGMVLSTALGAGLAVKLRDTLGMGNFGTMTNDLL